MQVIGIYKEPTDINFLLTDELIHISQWDFTKVDSYFGMIMYIEYLFSGGYLYINSAPPRVTGDAARLSSLTIQAASQNCVVCLILT